MKDIENKEDIKVFVNGFYDKVREDELLAPVFASRIPDENWGMHLEKMYGFWNTILFFQKEYKGNPFAKHIGLGATKIHFDRWVALFQKTIDENFSGPHAEEAKMRGDRMAQIFQVKLAHIADNPGFKPVM